MLARLFGSPWSRHAVGIAKSAGLNLVSGFIGIVAGAELPVLDHSSLHRRARAGGFGRLVFELPPPGAFESDVNFWSIDALPRSSAELLAALIAAQ